MRIDPWFTLPEGEAHSEVWRIAMRLREEQGEMREQDADDSLALYFGNTRNGLREYASSALPFLDMEPPGYNVIQACVDTKVNHLLRNKVRPFFLTDEGNEEQREKATGMQRAVEGIFYDNQIYGPVGVDVCFDGNLFKAGGVKWTPDYANMRVSGERVFEWEVFVPEREALRGDPRQCAHVQTVDRSVLLDRYKDAEPRVLDAIKNAKVSAWRYSVRFDDTSDPGHVTDMIEVAELWHRPSGRVDRKKPEAWGRDAKGNACEANHDGRHVICVEGETLYDEPWPFDYFPIAWFKPQKKPIGWWSRSLPETLAGAQLALNRMNTRVDGIMHLHARPLVVTWRKANINPAQLTNAWATVMESDQPPGSSLQYFTPASVPAEYLARIDKIIAWAEKQAGLSELSIAAQKPAGIEHAPALQHLADEQNIRHTNAFMAWEWFHQDSARMAVDCCRMLAEYAAANDVAFDVVWGDDKKLKRIQWTDVDLDEALYRLKVWPTNLLPNLPAAKMSRLIEYLKSGVFTLEEVRSMLEFPDVQAAFGDATAPERNIKRKLADLLKTGNYEAAIPHSYLNLKLAKKIAAEKINQLEADGVDPEKVDLVIQFHEDVEELIAKMAVEAASNAPPAGPGGPMAGAPQGMAA